MLNLSEPLLIFDFANHDGTRKRLFFKSPVKIISTSNPEKIIPSLREIQRAIDSGLYAAGYISHEAAPAFDPRFRVKKGGAMPLLWFGLFHNPHSLVSLIEDNISFSLSEWQPTISRKKYNEDISKIKEAIKNGQTYQVNYTMRLRARFEGNDLAFYHHLLNGQRASYCAYLNLGRFRVLSVSPELFFRWDGNQIVTKPMKGTIKRGRWPAEDDIRSAKLRNSAKNQAENVMIVDLLRNDLGRICNTGSVKVTQLFEIERYPTVFQMTSTITGVTSKGTKLENIFSALFPSGSVTGAPKVSTMDIITELEKSPREVYCGTIGFASPSGEALFNVAIRTVIIDAYTNIATYGVGGGITWDSTAEEEFDEALAKAAVLTANYSNFDLLETLRLDYGQYTLLEKHLKRLETSANYFDFQFSRVKVEETLHNFSHKYSQGVWRVRLLVSQNGEIHLEKEPLHPTSNGPLPVALAPSPISRDNCFLFHKTTYREPYNRIHNSLSHVFDVLFWNQEGELTEFTLGNLVLELDGELWTPVVDSGLLPGTFREYLIERGEIKERILTLEDLKKADRIWLINSVRGWVPVYLVHSPSKLFQSLS
ncbi:Para-aminobenzoate synthase, subunit I [[Clostridium] ultunense Esp]|nr:Para-aminobenzoate synthase, subunit I [[Clostridium] ultunense Esp]